MANSTCTGPYGQLPHLVNFSWERYATILSSVYFTFPSHVFWFFFALKITFSEFLVIHFVTFWEEYFLGQKFVLWSFGRTTQFSTPDHNVVEYFPPRFFFWGGEAAKWGYREKKSNFLSKSTSPLRPKSKEKIRFKTISSDPSFGSSLQMDLKYLCLSV